MDRDINGLTQSEEQVKDRIKKTLAEKNKLSQIVNSGNNKMLSDNVYARLCKDIFKIYKQIKTAPSESAEVPPLNQLFEIEKFLEDSERYLTVARERDAKRIESIMKEIKTAAKNKKKELQEKMRK